MRRGETWWAELPALVGAELSRMLSPDRAPMSWRETRETRETRDTAAVSAHYRATPAVSRRCRRCHGPGDHSRLLSFCLSVR